ncbi:heme biosynthesis HemY N-terminal domain-containing protein [Halothiobacillus sp.]|uniref:heme biosynthesis HemY N-terminal domain-containing protein n=1 Tax=Halothiobacillus sp. TaxID=1891311 RepID=UPI00261B591B|nr:heme biosynthesis HemY N-terminal domain-containing protein [Halothiobacillus sp.]MDD4966679.1 heme biosynthesis HemY N-terminal domain-containing protein [Halothiobacillus sp.]
MKRFALILIILVLAAGAGFYFIRDPGTADIALLGWELQTTALGLLALIIVGFIALAIIWRVISAVLKLPALWRRRSARQKQQAADEQLLRAWAELERGRFAVAEKLARASLNEASLPPLNYVIAADALMAQGETAATLSLLDEVRGTFPRFADFLSLHMANRFRQQKNLAPALELLQSLAAAHPKDEAIVCAFAETLFEAADWEKLRTLMPALRRLKWSGLTEQDIQRYDRAVYGGLIQAAARHKQTSELAALWNDAPKSLRHDGLMLASLANSWLTLGQPDEAERILETALDQQCTPALLHQWLALPPKDPARALTQFNRWASQGSCASDTNLRAYAEARLAWLNDDTEAAKQALAPVLDDHPDVPSLKLAAQIAEHERDSAQAVIYYTKAFELMDMER